MQAGRQAGERGRRKRGADKPAAAREPVQAPLPGPYLVRARAGPATRAPAAGAPPGPPPAPAHLASSPGPPPPTLPPTAGPEAASLGGTRSRGSRGCGGLPGIPAQGMREGFPSFCLYMAEARQRCSVGPTGPRDIVLRGCLASGSEALDSCENLAGKLFDSFDNVLESLREVCPGGPGARGVSAARRAGELGQQARGSPLRVGGPGREHPLWASVSRAACGVCSVYPPRMWGGTWAPRGASEVTPDGAASLGVLLHVAAVEGQVRLYHIVHASQAPRSWTLPRGPC